MFCYIVHIKNFYQIWVIYVILFNNITELYIIHLSSYKKIGSISASYL